MTKTIIDGPKLEAVRLDWSSGEMDGSRVRRSVKTVGELEGIFADREAWRVTDPATVAYSVEWTEPVAAGTEGGLFWGTTTIKAGRVGQEYFMTRGHFHAVRDRAEYYGTVTGSGMLVLMEESGATRVETMTPGSLHYIPGCVAHRTVNTGNVPLAFWACWPSDAGHDYETIAAQGFGLRVMWGDGAPQVLEV